MLQYVKWINYNDPNSNYLVNSTLYVDNVNLIEGLFSVDKYTEVWSDDFIEWYVDGYVYNRINIKDNEYFNKTHYIKLNLAVGLDMQMRILFLLWIM